MTQGQWKAFVTYRDGLKDLCSKWMSLSPELKVLQKEAAKSDTPDYPLETPVVYNKAYDDIVQQDRISLIVIGDNPGKDEQLLKNNRYLVGQSGRIADGFFNRNPELNIDFRKNVIIMNKTPVHTAKTTHLRKLLKNGSQEIVNLIQDSQVKMAQMAAALHQELILNSPENEPVPELWLVGYSELKEKGLFGLYRNALKESYTKECWEHVYVYQHFSMNRFLVDLKQYRTEHPEQSLKQSLVNLGHGHRDEFFGTFNA